MIGMGENLWRAPLSGGDGVNVNKCSEFPSFLTRLLLTLGDQKALLFYLTFLPVFLDTSRAGTVDVMLMLGSAAAAIIGTKLGYAAVIARFNVLLTKEEYSRMRRCAAVVVPIAGAAIWLNSWTAD